MEDLLGSVHEALIPQAQGLTVRLARLQRRPSTLHGSRGSDREGKGAEFGVGNTG